MSYSGCDPGDRWDENETDGTDATDGRMGRALVVPCTYPSYLSHPSHFRLMLLASALRAENKKDMILSENNKGEVLNKSPTIS